MRPAANFRIKIYNVVEVTALIPCTSTVGGKLFVISDKQYK